jgi:hypothetical protein
LYYYDLLLQGIYPTENKMLKGVEKENPENLITSIK